MAQQGAKLCLSNKRLGQKGLIGSRRKQRKDSVDNRLLSFSHSEGFALALLGKQNLDGVLVPLSRGFKLSRPVFCLLQHRQCFGESAEPARFFSRLPPVSHGLCPILRSAVVIRKQFRLLIK